MGNFCSFKRYKLRPVWLIEYKTSNHDTHGNITAVILDKHLQNGEACNSSIIIRRDDEVSIKQTLEILHDTNNIVKDRNILTELVNGLSSDHDFEQMV